MSETKPDLQSSVAGETLTTHRRSWRLRSEHVRQYGIIVVFIALFVVLSLTSPAFLSVNNLLNLLHQNAAVGIISCAATLVIILAGLDLSVGSVYIVGGVVAAYGAVHISVPVGIILGVLAGAVLGTLNGLITTKLRISSFLATLATSLVFSGAAVAITKGVAIAVATPSFGVLGNGGIGRVTYPVIIFAIFAVICQLVLSRTVYGRYIYAIGGNAEAARNSGIRVDLIRLTTFILCGFAAALGGVLDASTVFSGTTDSGSQLALASVAAIALGGTSIFGGIGSIWRTVLGVLLLAMIQNGFDLLSVASYYQDMVEGGIIIIAVAINSFAARE